MYILIFVHTYLLYSIHYIIIYLIYKDIEEYEYNKKALISASSNNHIDVVKLLLDKGANIEIKDKVFPIFI